MDVLEKTHRAQFAAIWAQDQNGLIGREGSLPWHLPADLAFFKCMTVGHTLVMGRKTFEGMNRRLLPDRETIILTRQKDYDVPEGARVLHSVDEILEETKSSTKPIMITGGSGIFASFMPYTDILYRTVIEASFEGDAYFPEIDWSCWEKVAVQEGKTDEKNPYPHRFETYYRINQ